MFLYIKLLKTHTHTSWVHCTHPRCLGNPITISQMKKWGLDAYKSFRTRIWPPSHFLFSMYLWVCAVQKQSPCLTLPVEMWVTPRVKDIKASAGGWGGSILLHPFPHPTLSQSHKTRRQASPRRLLLGVLWSSKCFASGRYWFLP